jgi:hypothetical protein
MYHYGPLEPIPPLRSRLPHGRCLKMCIRVKRRRIPTCNFRPEAMPPYFECCPHHVEEYLPSPFGRLRSCVFRQMEPRALVEEIQVDGATQCVLYKREEDPLMASQSLCNLLIF